MPEYLAPGVYVEETSFRAKSIEGVATSTCGFVGMTRFGPVSGAPMLVTSFEDYQRLFGDAADLVIGGSRRNQMAHSARLFFENGGRRLYVSRVFGGDAAAARARAGAMPIAGANRTLCARFPGVAGNLRVLVQAVRSGNLLIHVDGNRSLAGVRPGDVVEASTTTPKARLVDAAVPLAVTDLYSVTFDGAGKPKLQSASGTDGLVNGAIKSFQKVSLNIRVLPNGGGTTGTRTETYSGLSSHPDSEVFIGSVLRHENPTLGVEPPADRSNRIFLDLGDPASIPTAADARAGFAADLLAALLNGYNAHQLLEGSDGELITADKLRGEGSGHDATGLTALEAIEDIAIVAAPGSADLSDTDAALARTYLIGHAERMRYRFAILAGPKEADQGKIREIRGQYDSTYAGLYYPWLVLPAPGGASGETMLLSPEGAVAGIFARSDIERGVHKAPANEVVRGILRFSRQVNKSEQEVLNPEGINCLRFFDGRGNRVWGARTISSDPEWTYLNVRRLFIYMEHSIDRGTQWAVFEPNNESLWLRIRLTIESFLYDVWRTGALMGTKPQEAFFVRCDRTTMSQGDLDNGRLVCLIGVAPTKPAEFVIFRIGQWTADASII
jgi:phage tail sheath protein FI